MADTKKKKKLTKEQKEALDNQIVLATSVALVSTILLMFLYRWEMAYPVGTRLSILILMWMAIAGVAITVGGYVLKKDKKLLISTPYFTASAFACSLIAYNFLHYFGLNTGTKTNYGILYVIIAVYLVVSYVFYGTKLKKK